MGIPMGMPYFRLRELDSKSEVVSFSSNYVLYGDMSHRVMSLIAESVGNIYPYSIDESFFVLDDFNQMPHDKAAELAKRILQYTGIPVSIGIATTKTLAKTACKFAKKYKGYQSACIIDSEEKLKKALSLTALNDVWGIGRRSLPKLKNCGITTASDFVQKMTHDCVRKLFGLGGLHTWMELQGIDCIASENSVLRQSICTSRSFANMVSDYNQLESLVANFAAQCSRKLRKQHSVAQTVTVFIMSNRFRDELEQYANGMSMMLNVPVANTEEIVSASCKLLKRIFKNGILYKKAGVVVSSITPDSAIQTALFDENEAKRDRNDKLSAIIDSINSANGHDTICLAIQLPTDKDSKSTADSHLFTQNLRREHMSQRYTTSWEELLLVK